MSVNLADDHQCLLRKSQLFFVHLFFFFIWFFATKNGAKLHFFLHISKYFRNFVAVFNLRKYARV